jgi:hypothetical protein
VRQVERHSAPIEWGAAIQLTGNALPKHMTIAIEVHGVRLPDYVVSVEVTKVV